MPIKTIPYQDTGYFSKLVCDYLAEKPELKTFYNRFPRIENFEKQVKEKNKSFDNESRNLLVDSLKKQYKGISASKATKNNIDSL